eukprot:4990628-Pyramimonas_sp.AAC.2
MATSRRPPFRRAEACRRAPARTLRTRNNPPHCDLHTPRCYRCTLRHRPGEPPLEPPPTNRPTPPRLPTRRGSALSPRFV